MGSRNADSGTRRWTWEPDPAMTGEAVKEATWALLGIEVEQVVRPCLFRRFKRMLMVRDPEGSRRRRLCDVCTKGHPESGWQRIDWERSR